MEQETMMLRVLLKEEPTFVFYFSLLIHGNVKLSNSLSEPLALNFAVRNSCNIQSYLEIC